MKTMDDEERGYIFLTHLFTAIPLWGILFNGIMWLSFKEKSRRVVFHAHQGIFFQVVFLAAVLVGFVVFLFTLLVGALNEPVAAFLGLANRIIIYLILAAYELTCIYAMWSVLQGREFEYPLVARRLKEGGEGEGVSIAPQEEDEE